MEHLFAMDVESKFDINDLLKPKSKPMILFGGPRNGQWAIDVSYYDDVDCEIKIVTLCVQELNEWFKKNYIVAMESLPWDKRCAKMKF